MTGKDFNAMPELPSELAAALRKDARLRSERGDEFWSRQRLRIGARILTQKAPQRQPIRLALAGAVMLFLAVLLSAPAGRSPQPAQPVTVDADQQLLVAVEHALQSGTPEALEPVTLLVESSSNRNDGEGISNKEHHNEN